MASSEPRPAAVEASGLDHFLFSEYLEAEASLKDLTEGSTLRTAGGGPLPSEPALYLDELYADVQGHDDSGNLFRKSVYDMMTRRMDERPLALVSAQDRVASLSALLGWVYPSSMSRLAKPNRIADILTQDGARTFSFLALGNDDSCQPHYAACCLAYMNNSEAYPASEQQVLYVDDLAVSPYGQSGQLGIRMFRELLSRAVQYDVEAVELHARHSTSYRAFRGETGRRLFAGTGFAIDDHGLITAFGEGDDTEFFNLIRLTRNSAKEPVASRSNAPRAQSS